MATPQGGGDRATARRGQLASDGDAALLADLVDQARAGDQQSVSRIVVLCAPMVRAVAGRYVTNATDVEDVVQDVWVALAEHLDRIETPASLRAWLVQVTAHAAWRIRRRDGRARPLDEIGDRPAKDDTETQVVDRVHRTVVSARIRAALDQLRPQDRRLLTLLVANDRPDYQAIARVLSCPIGSIGPTRQRALKQLRRQPSLVQLVSPPAA